MLKILFEVTSVTSKSKACLKLDKGDKKKLALTRKRLTACLIARKGSTACLKTRKGSKTCHNLKEIKN